MARNPTYRSPAYTASPPRHARKAGTSRHARKRARRARARAARARERELVLLRTRRRRRALRRFGYALMAVGALALIDAGVTLVWQEPFSALYAKLRQDHLSGALRKVEAAAPTPAQQRALASLTDERSRIAYLAAQLQQGAAAGSAVGRIEIPQVGADYVVVKGTGESELRSGPGVYSETSFPDGTGTTAIAGHRTTYLAPFRNINQLRPGNRILLDMPYAHFTYLVVAQRVVEPTDVNAAISEVGYPRLVLSACTPLFSAAKRLLVYARLSQIVPVGAARELPGDPAVQPISQPAPGTPVGGAWAHLPAVLPTT